MGKFTSFGKIACLLLLSLMLVIFTACDEVFIDAFAEDMSLSASGLPVAFGVPGETEETYEQADEGYIPSFIPAPPMPDPPTEPTPEPDPPTPEPPRYKIALTFDDGPSPFTGPILDVLEQYNARATFFVLGNRVHNNGDIIRRTHALGNEVLGHSWNHANFANLSADAIFRQMNDTAAAIAYELDGWAPRLMRPPYGIVTTRARNVAAEHRYIMVNWSIDTNDWRNRCPDTIYDIVMENATHGAIVLLHDIRTYTAEAIERIVPSLIESGFELVTVSEILDYVYGELTPGNVYHGRRRPR